MFVAKDARLVKFLDLVKLVNEQLAYLFDAGGVSTDLVFNFLVQECRQRLLVALLVLRPTVQRDHFALNVRG